MTARRSSAQVLILVLGFASFVALGCARERPGDDALQAVYDSDGSRESEESARGAESTARLVADPTPEEPAPPATPVAATRKLIRTVQIDLRVDDTRAAAEELDRLTARLGGFVAALSTRRHGELDHFRLTLRVPSDRLDEAMAEIRAMAAEIDRESVQAQDVTDQYVDLEARLSTLTATETELQALLAEARQRDFDAGEVMVVYRELVEIRTRIERIQGQLQVLADRTSLATIDVELAPTEAAVPVVAQPWRPGETAKRSFRALVEGLRTLADLAIVFTITVLPLLLLIVLPLVWVVIRVRRQRRRRTHCAEESAPT